MDYSGLHFLTKDFLRKHFLTKFFFFIFFQTFKIKQISVQKNAGEKKTSTDTAHTGPNNLIESSSLFTVCFYHVTYTFRVNLHSEVA